MKRIIATIILIAASAIAVVYGQPVDPTYWHYKQKKANWLFEHDTVRINSLRIDNKLAIDSLGRIWWYDNSAATLGEILVGNGTYYNPLSIGTAGEVLTVTAGTATWEPATIAGGAITGLTENLILYGAADGSIGQDAAGIYNPATNTMTLGDAINPGRFVATDVTNSASISPSAVRISIGSTGSMEMQGDLLEFEDPGGDLFTIGRAAWSADMHMLFPSALPLLNQELYAATVTGSDVTLGWRTASSGTVTSIETTSPITGGTITSTGTIGIDNAAANASTKGAATFASADFNDNGSGTISIDYANGQAATSGQDGLLQSSDWTTFNNKGYTLTLTGSQGTMTDGQTYYSGAITTGTSTTAAINQVPIPQTGTIVAIYVYQLTAGTLATGESSTLAIRLNNTTDVPVSSSVLNSSATSTWSATGLSQAVTAGDYIELKFTGATWSTNPSNVRWTAVVFIR